MPDELTPDQSAEVSDITRAQGGGVGGLSVPKFSAIAPPPAEPPAPSPQEQIQSRLLDLYMNQMPQAAAADQAAAGQAAAAAARSRAQLAARQKQALETPLPALHTPEYKALPTPPTAKYREPWQALGNPLAAVALVAGAFTRNSATATMNIAAAAMNAQKRNDTLAYEEARSKFKDSMEETIKANENERNAYKDSWENRKLTFDERRAQLEMWGTYYQNAAMAGAARGGNVAKINAQVAGLEKSLSLLKEMNPVFGSKTAAEGKLISDGYQQAQQEAQRGLIPKEDIWKRAAEISAAPLKALEEATTRARAGVAGLSLDDRMKLKTLEAQLKRENISYADKSRLERELAVLERKGSQQQDLNAHKAQLAKEGRLELEEKKAENQWKLYQQKAEDTAKLQRERIEAKAKTLGVSDKERTKLVDLASAVSELGLAGGKFKDDYAGYGFGFAGDLVMGLEKFAGKSDAAMWWADYEKLLTIPERHKFFGSALTTGERASWDKGAITPGMSPEYVRQWFSDRQEAATRAVQREAQALIAAGVKKETVEGMLGMSLPEIGATPGAPPPPPGFR